MHRERGRSQNGLHRQRWTKAGPQRIDEDRFSPRLQAIMIGNMLLGDVKCITLSLTHMQTVFCKDSGLSGLSSLGLRILTTVCKEFSDSDSHFSEDRKWGLLLGVKK